MLSEYTSVLRARRGSPLKKSVSARCIESVDVCLCLGGELQYVLEEAQQVGDGFALAVGQDGVIDAVLGAAWGVCQSSAAGGTGVVVVQCLPPQQELKTLEQKSESPMAADVSDLSAVRGVRGQRAALGAAVEMRACSCPGNVCETLIWDAGRCSRG